MATARFIFVVENENKQEMCILQIFYCNKRHPWHITVEVCLVISFVVFCQLQEMQFQDMWHRVCKNNTCKLVKKLTM